MDLQQIEYFVHVAELGSFTRALRLLAVAQPALSGQVRALEVELRQPLFDRNGGGVTLTEPGKRLLSHGCGTGGDAGHAVLAPDAIQPSGNEAAFLARPIGAPPLTSTLWIATSAQRHCCPSIERSTALLHERLVALWAR